jgi:hypothetical protein
METNGATRHKHFNIFHILNRKIRNSIHHSQTSTKAQQEERKMKREDIRFGLRITLILQCGFHQNNNILLQQHWPRGLQFILQVYNYFIFFVLRPKQGHKVVD